MRFDNPNLTIQKLIENLQDSDQLVRLHAATVLGVMGGDAEPAVTALIDLLAARDVHDRKMAALTLGEIGPVAEAAVPALLDAAKEDDEGVSDLAIWALEQIDLAEIRDEAA